MNPFYQQAQKLRKTDNLEAVIYKFGQLGLWQAKHFIPPFTRAGEDPVPATDADAKKLVDALAVRRSIKLTGDVIYPFVGEKTTPISYNQSHIDCIWALLSKYVSMGISLPITFCILDGSPLDDPSEIKYLTRKK